MRVALIVPGFSASADDWAIPALQLLASELARAHEVVLFSLRYPAGTPKQFGGLRHVALGGGTRRGLAAVALWRRAVAAIGAAHRQQPFDVLHAFWADEAGLVAGLAGRWLSRPVLVSVAGGELVYLRDIGYGTQRSWFRRRVVGAALRLAGGVTAGSAYQMALCQAQGVPAGRLHLAPLGLDTAHFTPAGVVSPGPLTLVQAASLVPVKNQRLLLAVLAAGTGGFAGDAAHPGRRGAAGCCAARRGPGAGGGRRRALAGQGGLSGDAGSVPAGAPLCADLAA